MSTTTEPTSPGRPCRPGPGTRVLADMGALIGILGHIATADTEPTPDQLTYIESQVEGRPSQD